MLDLQFHFVLLLASVFFFDSTQDFMIADIVILVLSFPWSLALFLCVRKEYAVFTLFLITVSVVQPTYIMGRMAFIDSSDYVIQAIGQSRLYPVNNSCRTIRFIFSLVDSSNCLFCHSFACFNDCYCFNVLEKLFQRTDKSFFGSKRIKSSFFSLFNHQSIRFQAIIHQKIFVHWNEHKKAKLYKKS